MKLYSINYEAPGPYNRTKYCYVWRDGEHVKQCSVCGRRYSKYDGDVYVLGSISEDRCRWNDFVMNSGGGPGVVTGRVVNGLECHGIKGWQAHRVSVPTTTVAGESMDTHLLSHKKAGESMPELYVLETTHWGKLDLVASGLGGSEFCPECRMTMPPVKEPERLVIDESTFDWEASDFFHFFPWGQLRPFVTRRVIEVARAAKWKGVYFIPLGIPYDITKRHKYKINPLAKEWPPKEHWD